METNKIQFSFWHKTPPEILNEIFSYLNKPEDKIKVYSVCKSWYNTQFVKTSFFDDKSKGELAARLSKGKQREIKQIEKKNQEVKQSTRNKFLKGLCIVNETMAFSLALTLVILSKPNVIGYVLGIPIFTVMCSLPGLCCVGFPVACLMDTNRDPITNFFKRKTERTVAGLPRLSDERNLEEGIIQGNAPTERSRLLPYTPNLTQ